MASVVLGSSVCRTSPVATAGEPIPDPDAVPRVPCPKCQSIKRTVSAVFHAHGTATVTAVGQAIDYPTSLLEEADTLLTRDKKFGLVIVVAHTASEVAAQRAFARAFAKRGVPDLEEPVSDLFSSYNLGNERVRKVYTALTGDLAGSALPAWWKPFKDSVERRNDIVHEGTRATEAEAIDSLAACAQFVKHVS